MKTLNNESNFMVPTSVRLDKSLKKNAQAFANSAGISFSTLVSASLRQVIRSGRIVIDVTDNGFSKEFEESILKAEKEGGTKSFESVDDMIEYATNENKVS